MASSDAPVEVGHVALRVRDVDKVADFYRDVIGLAPLHTDGETRHLGAGNRTLIELQRDASALPRNPRGAGLFHTAFLLPSHQALADWLSHAVGQQTPLQGAADHLVSEAIYLADPEGNGIEVYADRPRETWSHTAEGVVMSTEHLDLDALLREAGSGWRGIPEDGVVGHVHLRVGGIPQADDFYIGLLGMRLTTRYPGASFYSTGGYHHHIAANIWKSQGAVPLTGREAGLAGVTLRADNEERKSIGVRTGASDHALTVSDPWNIPITVVVKDD